jgi:hypothetical protein
MGVVDEEAYASGRVFISKSSTSPLQAVADTTLAPTLFPLAKSSSALTTAGREPTPSKILLAKSAASLKVLAPRHDPLARGALVLQVPAESHQGVAVVVDPVLSNHLRPHQREGVAFLWDCLMGLRMTEGQGCILADVSVSIRKLATIAGAMLTKPTGAGHGFREDAANDIAHLDHAETAHDIAPCYYQGISGLSLKPCEQLESRIQKVARYAPGYIQKHLCRLQRGLPRVQEMSAVSL